LATKALLSKVKTPHGQKTQDQILTYQNNLIILMKDLTLQNQLMLTPKVSEEWLFMQKNKSLPQLVMTVLGKSGT
jgi:hypothetical protein